VITATLKIRFGGDWVDEIGSYDVSGIGVASTFLNKRFVGITYLDSRAAAFDDVVATIEGNRYVESLEVVEYQETGDRVRATVWTVCDYPGFTPMQMIRFEGFLPIGYPTYEDGYEYLTILSEDRADVSRAVTALEFDSVEVVRIVSRFGKEIGFSLLEWQQLLRGVSEDERELLHLAIERGYYDVPRRISLAELADAAGVVKSTASRRLRTVESAATATITKYLRLFAER
jgi:predicted DNA binding protein